MRMLVVTNMFSAVRDALKEDGVNFKGMPGFLKAMQYFTEQGIEIDYIFTSFVSTDKKFMQEETKLPFIKKEQIKGIIIKNYRVNKLTHYAFMDIALLSSVKKALKQKKYDFIYAMTPDSSCVNKLANSMGIPCGVRLYGSFLWSTLQKKGIEKTRIYSYREIEIYNLPKSFLLTTDDGSNGEKSYEMFCENKTLYDFYYWKNGIDRCAFQDCKKYMDLANEFTQPAILYVATVTPWKRHDRAIELMKILKDRGINCNLYFAGSMPPSETEKAWKKKLDDMISEYNLQDRISFLGSLEKEEFLYLSKSAIACPLFQDTTNMGNVFHELLSVGAPIISLDDGSLDDFITDGENGFLVKNMEEAADIVEKLISDSELSAKIRLKAQKTSEEKMISWDERFEKEYNLIKNAVENK